MLFQLKKLPEIINLTRFLKSFWILYIDQIIVYNAFCSTLTFYIIKNCCQIHALKVFRSPVWLLLHKLSSPHYRCIRKMRRGDCLPLTQQGLYVPCPVRTLFIAGVICPMPMWNFIYCRGYMSHSHVKLYLLQGLYVPWTHSSIFVIINFYFH
jgi:hypothetical protein